MSTHPVDLLAAHALDALEPDEAAAVERHLDGCASCRAEVDAHRAALTAVADAVPRHAAPSGLRDRLMARVETAAADGESRAASPTPPATAPARGAEVRSAPSPRPTPGPWRPLALAAGLAALMAGVAWWQARGRVDELAGRVATLEGRAASLQAEATASARLVARQDSLLEIALGTRSATAFLASERLPTARVFFSADRSRVLLSVADLPPAASGRTYQLWGIPDGGSPVSLGVFDTAADGSAVVLLDAPVGDYALSAVSEEPTGGSPQPTTTPFLLGEVAED